MSKEPQVEGFHPIGNWWQAPGNTFDCLLGVRNSQNFPQGIETPFWSLSKCPCLASIEQDCESVGPVELHLRIRI